MGDRDRMKAILENDISIPENVEMTEPLKIYLKEIGQIPLLSEEEELMLGKQIAAGDLDARRRMEESNLSLVVSAAGLYAGQGMQFMDLIQEGNIGLMHAAGTFDYKEGRRFSEHAFPLIDAAIRLAVEEQSMDIQVPAHVAESMQKVQKTARKLKQDLGRDVTSAEIAQFLGDKTAEEVESIQAMLHNPSSVGEAFMEKEDSGFEDPDAGEADAQEDAVNSLIRQEEVAQLLGHLSPVEQKAIRLRFGLEGGKAHTYEEVGEAMDMSGEQIRQIEGQAMNKLREAAGKHE